MDRVRKLAWRYFWSVQNRINRLIIVASSVSRDLFWQFRGTIYTGLQRFPAGPSSRCPVKHTHWSVIFSNVYPRFLLLFSFVIFQRKPIIWKRLSQSLSFGGLMHLTVEVEWEATSLPDARRVPVLMSHPSESFHSWQKTWVGLALLSTTSLRLSLIIHWFRW